MSAEQRDKEQRATHQLDNKNGCKFAIIYIKVTQDFENPATVTLKVFTNEKRGGLRVISFDRPPFKGTVS
jgi:hypothetical protein